MYLVGLGGVINETFLAHLQRPYLAMIFAGMIGVPQVRKADASKADDEPVAGKHRATS